MQHEEGSCLEASSGSLYTDKSLEGTGGVSMSEEDSSRESSQGKGKPQVKEEIKTGKKVGGIWLHCPDDVGRLLDVLEHEHVPMNGFCLGK